MSADTLIDINVSKITTDISGLGLETIITIYYSIIVILVEYYYIIIIFSYGFCEQKDHNPLQWH